MKTWLVGLFICMMFAAVCIVGFVAVKAQAPALPPTEPAGTITATPATVPARPSKVPTRAAVTVAPPIWTDEIQSAPPESVAAITANIEPIPETLSFRMGSNEIRNFDVAAPGNVRFDITHSFNEMLPDCAGSSNRGRLTLAGPAYDTVLEYDGVNKEGNYDWKIIYLPTSGKYTLSTQSCTPWNIQVRSARPGEIGGS